MAEIPTFDAIAAALARDPRGDITREFRQAVLSISEQWERPHPVDPEDPYDRAEDHVPCVPVTAVIRIVWDYLAALEAGVDLEVMIRRELEYRLRTTAAYYRMRGSCGEEPRSGFIPEEADAGTAAILRAIETGGQAPDPLPYARTHSCTACGATVARERGIGWVDVVSGDDGGTYDICPESDEMEGPHQVTAPGSGDCE